MSYSKMFFVLAFIFSFMLATNYVVLRVTGEDYLVSFGIWLHEKSDTIQAELKKKFKFHSNVKVSESRFEEMFREICPEFLGRYGIPLSKVYADMVDQYEGQIIDELFVRKLLEDLKNKYVSYDGKAFYRMDNKDSNDKVAGKDIDPEFLKKDTVPIQFFLDNEVFYSRRIFNILTKQRDVTFAHVIKDGRYFFEAQRDMTQTEFFSIVSNIKPSNPQSIIRRGDQWGFAPATLREISRVFEVNKNFVDHLGIKRAVVVYLDLANYVEVNSTIASLPDGTLITNEKGPLSMNVDTLNIQRVNGREFKHANGWGYEEDGKIIFKAVNNVCQFIAYGKCENVEAAGILVEESTGKHIFQAKIAEGTVSLVEANGTRFRIIDGVNVKDANGNPVVSKEDIGYKVQQAVFHSSLKMKHWPNLEAYIDTSPFMKKLVHDIMAFYKSKDDKVQAVLDFVHSFKYEPGMIISYAKGPKEYLLSLEGDCKDASILAGSLWAAADIPFAFGYFSNTNPNKAGHAALFVKRSACCSGKPEGDWLYAEATGTKWLIGQDPEYTNRNLELRVFQPYGKPPVKIK